MATRPRGPWLPWKTINSSRQIGAGEDGRVFRGGWFLIFRLESLYTPTHTDICSSSCVFQLYSLFLTAAAGHLTEGRGSAAAWADAMHAGTRAMRR